MLTDFTLSNTRQFYSSTGGVLGCLRRSECRCISVSRIICFLLCFRGALYANGKDFKPALKRTQSQRGNTRPGLYVNVFSLLDLD